MTQLTLEKARLTGVEIKIGKEPVTLVKVAAQLSRPMAKAMGAEYALYDGKDSLPKQGWKKTELDFEMRALEVTFDVSGLASYHLELKSLLADKFMAVRVGNKKKGVSFVVVKFRLHVRGREHELLDFLMTAGGADGVMYITSRQEEQQDLLKPPAKGRAARKDPAVLAGGVIQ